MKTFRPAMLAMVCALAVAGCADSDRDNTRHHHAGHRRHHHGDGDNSAAPTATPAQGPAGASNAALGNTARDALGHPAIDEY